MKLKRSFGDRKCPKFRLMYRVGDMLVRTAVALVRSHGKRDKDHEDSGRTGKIPA